MHMRDSHESMGNQPKGAMTRNQNADVPKVSIAVRLCKQTILLPVKTTTLRSFSSNLNRSRKISFFIGRIFL